MQDQPPPLEFRQELREIRIPHETRLQLYVKGEFIGGADIVKEMFQSGELKTHMTEQGLIT